MTLYNYYRDKETGTEGYIRTVLDQVFWDSSTSVGKTRTGSEETGEIDVYIPFTVQAEGKIYCSPKEWRAGKRKNCWTLTSGKDFIVKGVCSFQPGNEEKISELLAKRDEVFAITSYSAKDFGSKSMRHWVVRGK